MIRVLVPALLLVGCSSAPDPNPAIGNTLDPPVIVNATCGDVGIAIACNGPERDLLGDLCGYSASQLRWSREVGQMTFIAGPDDGAHVIVYGFTPLVGGDVSDVIEYAAYLVLNPSGVTEEELLGEWDEGDSLDGNIITQEAIRIECDVCTFVGQARFEWRSTMIELAWAADSPCS